MIIFFVYYLISRRDDTSKWNIYSKCRGVARKKILLQQN